MNIIYPGSFDPLSKAHLAIARYIRDRYKAKVIFVPVSDGYKKNDLLISFDHRYRMIKETIKDDKDLYVSDIEDKYYKVHLKQPKTIVTLDLLPDIDGFIIGADNYIRLKDWYKGDELISNNHIYVISRDDIKIDSCSNKTTIVDLSIDISSSMIREGRFEYLDHKTLSYIKDHQDLYDLLSPKSF